MQEYCAYIYYDRLRREPIYVGKGKLDRPYQHLGRKDHCEFVNRLKKMIREQNDPMISVYSGLDNELACLVEQELIAKFGRKDLGLGPLLNLTNGGEGTPGRVATDEFRKNMSIGRKGKKPADTSNYKVAAKNRVYSAERNEAVSKGLMGHSVSDETKAKIGAKSKINSAGEKNGMFGKKHSEATKAKIAEKAKLRSLAKQSKVN